MNVRSLVAAPLALVLLLALLVSACGDDADSDAAATGESPAVTDVTEAGQGSGGPSTTTDDEPDEPDDIVAVTVAGGRVDGPGRVEVSVGDEVTVEVTSDVADEVHVHGVDELFDIEAGGTTPFSFVADIPGVFEVELHSSSLLLFELAVR